MAIVAFVLSVAFGGVLLFLILAAARRDRAARDPGDDFAWLSEGVGPTASSGVDCGGSDGGGSCDGGGGGD